MAFRSPAAFRRRTTISARSSRRRSPATCSRTGRRSWSPRARRPTSPICATASSPSDDTRLSGIVMVLVRRQRPAEVGRQRQPDHHHDRRQRILPVHQSVSGRLFGHRADPAGGLHAGHRHRRHRQGTADGLVVNSYTYSSLGASTLSILSALNSSSIAIANIPLERGRRGGLRTISAMCWCRRSRPQSPPSSPGAATSLPPIEPVPPMALARGAALCPVPADRHVPLSCVEGGLRPMAGGAAGPEDFSWHLSVIDAGQPRRDGSGDQYAVTPRRTATSTRSRGAGPTWGNRSGSWPTKTASPLTTFHFGMPGAVPVTGDWDGSGTTKIGVFLDGLWFLDLNGNGAWDEKRPVDQAGEQGRSARRRRLERRRQDGHRHLWPRVDGATPRPLAREPGLPDAQNVAVRSRPKNVPARSGRRHGRLSHLEEGPRRQAPLRPDRPRVPIRH